MNMLSLLILFVLSPLLSFAEEQRPVGGSVYFIEYDPMTIGVLANAESIAVVYVFDYWGTKVVRRQGESGRDLFRNVLEPDSGRAATTAMKKVGHRWTVGIPIPDAVQLLSYYFTDGVRRDDNNRRTYTSYIYTYEGKPVRGARFRNVDFLFMAGEDIPAVVVEINKEIADYPDNFIAHVVYWRYRLQGAESLEGLEVLRREVESHFSELHSLLGDTVLNYKALSLNEINNVLFTRYREKMKTPEAVALVKSVNTSALHAIESLPEERRTKRAVSLLPSVKDLLLSPEERAKRDADMQREFEEMLSEFVGQAAPDFAFETTQGTQHRLSDFKGRYVLLDFWGSWCGPCLQEIPNLVKLHKKFGSRITMISITNDAASSKWDQSMLIDFAAKNGMGWMQVLDDPNTTIHKLYKIRFWPNMFLLDKDGTVMQRKGLRGAELEHTLTRLLGE